MAEVRFLVHGRRCWLTQVNPDKTYLCQKYVRYEATFWGAFAMLMLVYKKNVCLIFTNIHTF